MKRQALALLVAISATSCALAAKAPSALGGSVTPIASAPAAAPTAGTRVFQPQPGQPMTLDVYPRMIMAQSNASIRLRIEPDARSRSVLIEWDSPEGGAGGRLIQLDGEDAAIRYDVPLKGMTAGEYEVVATLIRSDGTRVTRATTLNVFGR
jgi:hypothetical protein